MMQARVIFFMVLLLFAGAGNFASAEEGSFSSNSSKNNSKLSSIQTHKTAQTTQKTYQVKNNGTNQNSKTVEYAQSPDHAVFEDKDSDGRFGENEAKGVDQDKDGRKGEKEAQLGLEKVTQNQKITVLDNMGMGSGLSSFQAAGQTQTSSIFVDDKKSAEHEEPPHNEESPQNQSASQKDTGTKTQSPPARRVLVS